MLHTQGYCLAVTLVRILLHPATAPRTRGTLAKLLAHLLGGFAGVPGCRVRRTCEPRRQPQRRILGSTLRPLLRVRLTAHLSFLRVALVQLQKAVESLNLASIPRQFSAESKSLNPRARQPCYVERVIRLRRARS